MAKKKKPLMDYPNHNFIIVRIKGMYHTFSLDIFEIWLSIAIRRDFYEIKNIWDFNFLNSLDLKGYHEVISKVYDEDICTYLIDLTNITNPYRGFEIIEKVILNNGLDFKGTRFKNCFYLLQERRSSENTRARRGSNKDCYKVFNEIAISVLIKKSKSRDFWENCEINILTDLLIYYKNLERINWEEINEEWFMENSYSIEIIDMKDRGLENHLSRVKVKVDKYIALQK